MYTAHYGLSEKPFRLTPDPRFYFLSASHREALAHVVYGIEQGEGFICVTGEVGTGKTTLCRTMLDRLGSETEVAYLFNPMLSPGELLPAVAMEFGLEVEGSAPAVVNEALNRFLLESRRRVLLLVDEAQNLSVETLEEIRLLSNLETATAKLIQIVLFGQPEFDAMLASPALRQLRQRIAVRWTLEPLTDAEAQEYVCHRVRVAAGGARDLFTARALREIRRRARGIPRLVNLLADRSLLAGFAEGKPQVDRAQVARAARELRAGHRRRRARSWRRVTLAGAAVLWLGSMATLDPWSPMPATQFAQPRAPEVAP